MTEMPKELWVHYHEDDGHTGACFIDVTEDKLPSPEKAEKYIRADLYDQKGLECISYLVQLGDQETKIKRLDNDISRLAELISHHADYFLELLQMRGKQQSDIMVLVNNINSIKHELKQALTVDNKDWFEKKIRSALYTAERSIEQTERGDE